MSRCRKTWFLDRLERIPEDLENYAPENLCIRSRGLGVVIAPKKRRYRRNSGEEEIGIHSAGAAAF
jgi:hypothetical protein